MKAFSVFLSALVLFVFYSVSPAAAAEKSLDLYYLDDVDYDHWAYERLERFLYADLIDGYIETEKYEEDGEEYEYSYVSIKPNNPITRAEFTKILVNAMNLSAKGKGKSFPDVKSTNWFYNYVSVASSNGIINGKTDGSFKPNDKITREEITAMIYRAFKNSIDFSATGKAFSDVSSKSFAYEAIQKTAAAGIIEGYGNGFRPYNNATRAEAITMVDRALHQEIGTAADQQVVAQIVDRNITDEMKFTEEQDFESLEALYHETTIGYYLALSLESIYMNELEEDPDTTFTIEQVGEHTIQASSVNKNFAQVRIEDLCYDVSMTTSKMSFSMTMDLSGTAYLKKSTDGKWKIYNVVFDEDIYDQGIEEALMTEID